jgi:hypothetical protein
MGKLQRRNTRNMKNKEKMKPLKNHTSPIIGFKDGEMDET